MGRTIRGTDVMLLPAGPLLLIHILRDANAAWNARRMQSFVALHLHTLFTAFNFRKHSASDFPFVRLPRLGSYAVAAKPFGRLRPPPRLPPRPSLCLLFTPPAGRLRQAVRPVISFGRGWLACLGAVPVRSSRRVAWRDPFVLPTDLASEPPLPFCLTSPFHSLHKIRRQSAHRPRLPSPHVLPRLLIRQ